MPFYFVNHLVVRFIRFERIPDAITEYVLRLFVFSDKFNFIHVKILLNILCMKIDCRMHT